MFPAAEALTQTSPYPTSWSIAGKLPAQTDPCYSSGIAGAVCGVHNGRMLIAGGTNFPDAMPWQGGSKKYYRDVSVFTRNGDHMTPVAGSFSLPKNIAYAACCATLYGLFYAGGENETGLSDRAGLIQWDETAGSVIVQPLPDLPTSVTNASTVFCNNRVYVVGGESEEGVSCECLSIELSDTSTGWTKMEPFPKPVSHAVLMAAGPADAQNVYLFGGRKKTERGISELYDNVYKFDPRQNQWEGLSPLPYALSAGTGVSADQDTVILFGGDKGTTFSKVESYIAAIGKTSNTTEKEQLIREKNLLQESHPGFSREILAYHVATGKCDVVGTLPYPAPVTTTAFWWDDAVVIPSGEVRAGARSPHILMTKLQ